MFDLMYSEVLKLKKSKTILGIFMSCLFIPVIWSLLGPFYTEKFTWKTYTSGLEDSMFMVIGTAAFVLLTSYIFLREYQDDTEKELFTYPVSKISILICKIVIIYIIIALIYFLHFALVFAGGLLVVQEPLTKEYFLRHGRAYLWSMLLEFSLIPLIVFFVNLFKNITISAIIAVLIVFSNFCMFEINKYKYWPFFLIYLPRIGLYKTVDMKNAFIFSIAIFIVGILLNIAQLSKVKDF